MDSNKKSSNVEEGEIEEIKASMKVTSQPIFPPPSTTTSAPKHIQNDRYKASSSFNRNPGPPRLQTTSHGPISSYANDRGTFPGDRGEHSWTQDRDPRDRDAWYNDRPEYGTHGGGYVDRLINAWRGPNKPLLNVNRNRTDNWPPSSGAGFDREREQLPYHDELMRMNSSQMPSSAPPHLIRQHSAPEYLNQPPSAQPLFHPQQQNFQSRSPQFKPNSTTNPTAADRGPQGVRPGAPRGPRPTDGFKPALYPSVKVAHSIGVSKPSSAENKTTTSAAVNNKPVSSFKPAPIESSSATSATPAATASAATTAITSVSSSTAASASTNKTTPAPLIRIVSDSITGSATAKPVIMSRIGQTIKSTTSTSSTAGEATAAKVTAPTPVVAPPTLMQDLKSSSSIFDLVGGFNLIKDKSNDQQKESTAVEHKNDKDEDNDNDDNEDDEQKIVPTSSSFSLRQLSTSSTGSKSVNDIANLDEPQSSVETTDSLLTRSPSFSASAWGRGLTPRPVLKQNSDQQEVETATVSSVVIDSSSQVVSESQTVSVTPASVPINTPAPASQAPVVAATGAEKFRMEMKAAVAAIKRAPPPQPQSQAQQVERSSTSSTTTTASLHRDMLIKKRAAESQITKDTHKIPTKPSSSPVSKRIIESDTESNVGKDNDTDIGDNDTDNVQKESIERKKASVLLGSKSPSKTPSRSPTAKAAIKSQFKPKSPQPMSDDTSGVGLKRKPSSDSIESSSQLGQIGKNEPIDETTATATATTTTATDGINELTTVPTPQPPFLVSAVVAKKKPGPKQRAREREQNAILQQSMGIAPVIPTKQSKPRVINELKSTVAYSDKNAPVAQPVVCSSNQRQPRTGPPMPTVVAKYRTPLPKVTLNKIFSSNKDLNAAYTGIRYMENFKTKYIMTDQPKNTKQGKSGMTHNPNPTSQIQIGLNSSSDFVPSARRIQEVLFPSQYEISHMLDLLELKVDSINQRLHDNRQRSFQFSKYLEKILTQGVPNHMNPFHQNYAFKQQSSQQSSSLVGSAGSVISAAKVGPTTTPTTTTTSTATGTTSATTPSVTAPTSTVSSAVASIGSTSNTTTTTTTISSSTRPVLTAITNRPLTAGKQSSQQGSEKYKVNLEKLHEISKENEVRIMAATLSRSPDHLELVSKCTKIGLKIQNKNYRDGRAVYQMMKDEVLSLLTYSASLPSASTATSNTVFALPTTSANTTSATPSSTPSLTALTTQLGTTVTSKNSNLASSVVALTKPSVSIISLTPTFLENQESMNQLRPTMLKEIRRRKLQVRQAWELLGDHYLHVMHKWTKHIEAIADEDEAHEQMKLRAINQSNRFAPSVNPTPSSSGNLNTSSSTTSVSASNNSIGNSLSQNQENQRSSVRLSALNTPSSGPLIDPYTGNPFLPGQNVPLRPTADVIRSEYEQEKLILQLTATESLQVKIQKGKSDVPDMVSPWMRPDTFACAEYPVWPSSVREFVSGPLRKKVKKVGMTATSCTGNVDVEMVGDRNITGTVMPKSDEFQISITLSEQVEELPLPTVEEFRRVSVGMVPPITVTDSSSSRLTLDGRKQFCGLLDCKVICPYGCNCARQVDLKSRYERVWTDMEKCIFIDKFLQFPKNFYKISTFLTNRSTKDCIKFYYDSKATIPFKSLLREYENRRRNVRNTWSVSLSAAKAVGAQIYPSLDTDEREPFVELSLNDTICRSHMNQPMLLKRRLEEEEENEGVRKSTAKQLLATAVSEQRPTLLSTKPRLLTMLQYKIREKRQKMQDGIIPSDDEEDNDDHEDENNNNEKFTTMNKASISRSRTEDQDDVVNHDQRSQYSAFLLNRKQGIAHIIDKIDEIVPNASNELISGAFATATMSISGTATEQQATLASSSVLFSSSSSFSAEITSKNHGSLPGTNKKQQEIATSLLSGVAKNVQLLPPIPYQKLLKLDSEKLTQINWMSGCGHTVPSNTTNHTVTSMSTSTAAGAYANSLMIPGQHLLNANSITTQSTNLHFAQLSNEGIRAAIAIAAAGAPVSYSNSTTAASKSSGQSIPRAMNNPRVVNPKPTLPPRTKHNLVTSGLSASVALKKASEDGIANVNSLANTAKTSNVMPSATNNATSTTGVDGSVSMDIVEDSMTNDPTSTEASADTSTVSPPNPASSTVQPIPEAQTATAPTTAAARLSQSIVAANKLNRGISRPIGASASTTASSITANRLKTPTTTTIGRTGPASSLLNRTATTTTTTTGTVNNISIDNSDTQPVSIPPTSDSNNNNTEAPVDENPSSGAASSSHIAPSPTPVENEQTSINLSTDETATADVNDTNEDTIATGVNSTTEISILTVEDSTAVESHPASSEIVSENLTQTSVHVTESGQMDTEHVNQVTETISENVIDEKDI